MYKIAAVGDKDSVCGFQCIGLDVFSPDTSNEAAALLRRLESENYAVIFITEQLAADIEGEIQKYDEKPIPAIIPIPCVNGKTGLGMEKVKSAIEKAVGSDILS